MTDKELINKFLTLGREYPAHLKNTYLVVDSLAIHGNELWLNDGEGTQHLLACIVDSTLFIVNKSLFPVVNEYLALISELSQSQDRVSPSASRFSNTFWRYPITL